MACVAGSFLLVLRGQEVRGGGGGRTLRNNGLNKFPFYKQLSEHAVLVGGGAFGVHGEMGKVHGILVEKCHGVETTWDTEAQIAGTFYSGPQIVQWLCVGTTGGIS
jgi:hypothetical protein